MKAVFMGKNKRSAARALDWLAERSEVAAVVAAEPGELTQPEQRLDRVAERHGLALVSEQDLYAQVEDGTLGDVDLVLSFLFWNRIRAPLIELGMGCLNFHPAPLPDLRGLGGFNVAVLEGLDEWGVSCHFIDEEFDTGDLVQVDRFPIDPGSVTAFSLDLESQERLLALFQAVLGRALEGEALPREPQGPGRYVSWPEVDAQRLIQPGDDIDRKLRAFWYPPWPGAVIEVDGRELTLVDERLLADAARAYREAGQVP